MIIATCRGTATAAGTFCVELVKSAMRPAVNLNRQSNLHQLGLFLAKHLVDIGNVPVG